MMAGNQGGDGENGAGDHGLHGWGDEPAEATHPHFTPHEHERLDLDDGERLPWLEGDEEDEYFERVSPTRVILAGLGALLVLGAVVGGVWWTTHNRTSGQPVADGSTVSPPSPEYKQAPADPGGKTYQGTGDASYIVSQGHDRQAQLADDGSAGPAASGASAAGTPAKQGADKPVAAHPSAAGNGQTAGDGASSAGPVGGVVQIGAFSSADLAEAGWSRLSTQHPLLGQQHHRILQGQADIGTVFRLQVITAAGGGNALCERLRGEGLPCQVKH